MRRRRLILASLASMVLISAWPASAVTTRTDSKPYSFGAFSGLAVWPTPVEDATQIGENQCTKNQKNGACFPIQALETSASFTIVDDNDSNVGAWWQMLQCNTAVTSCSQLTAQTFCTSSTAAIPNGATHLQITLGFAYGQFQCPERVPGDTGVLHPGTWGHIDVTFYKPTL